MAKSVNTANQEPITDPVEAFEALKTQLGATTLKPALNIADIAKKHNVSEAYLLKQLQSGIEVEREHLGSDNADISAEIIALHHLAERPDYYELLKGVESAPKTYREGGQIAHVSGSAGGVLVGRPHSSGYREGGQIAHVSGSAGGVLVGRPHSSGGIEGINLSTGQPIEMEGGEIVITKNAVDDTTKREFEGEMLTNKQILSKINESGGGIKFDHGGELPVSCACDSRQYNYNGKKMELGAIIEMMNVSGDDFYQKEYMRKMIVGYKSKSIPNDLSTWLAHSELSYAELPHSLKYGGFQLNGIIHGGHIFIELFDGTIIDYYAAAILGDDSPISPKGWGREYFGKEITMDVLSLDEMSELLSAVAVNKQDIIKKYVTLVWH